MKSQFDAYSFGKFEVSNDYGNVSWKNKMSSPGVLEVTIPVSLSKSTQSQMRANVAEQVRQKLGFKLPGPFAHVVFVVENCYAVKGDSCGWAGTCDDRLPNSGRKQQPLSFRIFLFPQRMLTSTTGCLSSSRTTGAIPPWPCTR